MFAPVSKFAVSAKSGALIGYAAPAAGHWPSAVELWSGDRPIAVAAATRFSETAAIENLRAGWCGFALMGVGEAFALGAVPTVRCAASGAVLHQPSVAELAAQTPLVTPRLSLAEMIAWTRQASCASDLAQIMPFALLFSHRVGVGEFVEKTCMMLFQRFVSFGSAKLLADLDGDEDPETILEKLTTSTEFADDPLAYIPGPFHPEFRYGLEALD